MFGKECMLEKVVTTSKKSYGRIYLENIIFKNAGFDIGQKYTYYLDFKNKKVTIIPSKENKGLKYKGSMTRRMKKEYVPVLNIQSQDIEKVFEGINKCKIQVYKNEIIVQPLNDENEAVIEQSIVNLEDCNEDNFIDYNEYIKERIINGEAIEHVQPLIRITKDELHKFYNAHGLDKGKLDDAFEFNDDPFTNKVKEQPEVKKDIPILKKTMKVLSLFSGIGAFEKALEDINVDYELVNYCEIDESASKSYSAIHNVPESLNLWDVTKVKIKELINKGIKLITHGSPCQDISSIGLRNGFDEGSGTRSSLLWSSLNIIEAVKPKFVIWENVKAAFEGKNMVNVDKYIDRLKSIGYTSYCEILNSNEQGMPHSRPRAFVVSILGEHKPFEFPSKIPLKVSLQDFLFDNDKPAGVAEDVINSCREPFSIDYDEIVKHDKAIYTSRRVKGISDRYVGIKYVPCLRAQNRNTHVLDRNKAVRRITMKESWELMGFGKKAYEKVKALGMSLSQMQKQIGNSIDVNVLKRIFNNLFCCC